MEHDYFDRIVDILRASISDFERLFSGLKLIKYDEKTNEASIEIKDAFYLSVIKSKYSHIVINAFERVMGVPVTVQCSYDKSGDPPPPHQRFKIVYGG